MSTRQLHFLSVEGTLTTTMLLRGHGGARGPGEGELSGRVVTCPWHGWRYDVTSGGKVANPEIRIEKFEDRVEGGDVPVGKEPVRG
jgi:nitrite reductase/ring-hydroxylating ferredoxin subunit